MKIKRSSWHYKISNLGNPLENNTDNLCWYFWRAVFKMAYLIGILIFLIFLVHFWLINSQLISNTIMLFFIVSCIAVPFFAIRYLRRILGKSLEIPHGNIVTEYMRARKNKICPLIEYVD